MNITTKPSLVAVATDATPLDVLAARHRAAWDRTQRGRQEWIEGTLELATVLAEERQRLKANQDFSRWLERNGLDKTPDKDDRAALLGMAEDLTATREVLEASQNTNWQYIWRNKLQTRVRSSTKTQQATRKRSKADRQIIDKVVNLDERGYSYDETAEELGLTKGKVAGILFRVRNNKNNKPATPATPPPPKRWEGKGLDHKTLTREQVDPDFKGSSVEFATKYGHVLLHTKDQIEENRRQEVLTKWLGAVADHQKTAQALANAETPNPDTLRQWLAKAGKAERLQAWLTAIEAAYHNIDSIVPSLAVVGK